MSEKIKDEEKYNQLFELLSKAELAARNGEWKTCGTWARRVMELAFDFGK